MDEPLPLMGAPDAPSEDEYQAFVLALSESARGRALLAEHARRSRAADSEMLMSSVERLEGLVRSYAEAPPPPASPHDELRGMIEAIRGVQAELDISMLAEQVAKLATLIEGVQQRIETLAVPAPATRETPETPMPAVAFAAADEAAGAPAAVEPVAGADIDFAAASDAELAVEPAAELVLPEETTPEVSDESEAAEPAEDAAVMTEPPAPDEAPAADTAPAAETPLTELALSALVERLAMPAAAEDSEPEVKVYKAGTIPPPPPFAGEDFSGEDASADDTASVGHARAVPPPLDPLADIKALSEDERLALFT